MNMNQTLLVELFTEELPPKALAKLGDAFSSAMVAGLKARDFLNDDFSAKALHRRAVWPSASKVYALYRRIKRCVKKYCR
jgi:glycyl-tRNA synthetase beta subunit